MAKKKLLRKEFLKIEEAVDPKIINWENMGTPTVRKWFLRIVANTAVLAVLCVSFAGHWYLSGLQKDFNNVVRSDCSAEPWYDIDQAWIDETETEVAEKQGMMNCYCKQMYDLYSENALKITFPDGNQYCKDWHFIWVQARYTALGTGVWIAFTNFVLTIVCSLLGQLKKGKTTVETYKFTTWNIFMAHFINSALIIMLAQNCFLWSEEDRASYDRSKILVGVYDEFNSEWFLNVGSALLITNAFMLVVPHMFIIFQAIYLGCVRCHDRGFTLDTKNTKKIIQSEYEDLYTGPFSITEVRYGQALGVMSVTLTFSAGIPLLLPLTFIILFV